MFRFHRVGALLAAAFLLVASELSAGGTRSFRQTTAKDFEEGEATGSTILPSGEVAPGMKAVRIPLEAAFVWCAVMSPDGRTAYFGTGDQGAVYAVTLRQGSTAPAVRKLAELDAPWVTSLALRPDGTLLAGTTPGGRVFAIDPRKSSDKPEKNARPFAKLAAEHVWALAYDAKSGVTYAATGGGGKIFAIDAKGGVRLHWDSGDKHIVSLLALGDGRLLAGTSEEAILYRVSANGKAEALHDFEAEEVRAIARAGDVTYVAVNDFDAGGGSEGSATSGPVAAKGTKITLGSNTAPASAGALPRPTQVKAKSAVYRLSDDGSIEQVFA